MKPELGPPDVEEIDFSAQDLSWVEEWRNFRAAVRAGATTLDDLDGGALCLGRRSRTPTTHGYGAGA